jgi:hypothetical protein
LEEPVHPPGLDLERAQPYLAEASGDTLTGQLTATVISGGRSNLTYRVAGETGAVVVTCCRPRTT